MKKNVDKLKIAADQGSDEYLCFIKIILNNLKIYQFRLIITRWNNTITSPEALARIPVNVEKYIWWSYKLIVFNPHYHGNLNFLPQ